MNKQTNQRRKLTFFYLFLVDFIIAAQLVVVSLFSKSVFSLDNFWITKSFLLSFGLSLLMFLFSPGIFTSPKENKKIFQWGLFFLILGSLVGLLANDLNLFVLGRIFCGVGGAMVIVGQLGTIWHGGLVFSKEFSGIMTGAFVLGAFVSPMLTKFLSGPSLSELQVFFMLGTVVPVVTIFELSGIGKKTIGRVVEILNKEKKRLAIWGIGYLGNASIDFVFNFLLYPFIIWKYGILKGGIVMIFFSFLICYLIIVFYDWSKKDWLGIETIKSVKDYEGKSLIAKFISWAMKKSESLALIILSIKFDPFITTVYMRHGSHNYSGLSKRDWKIFMISLLIGNAYWILVAFTGVSILEYMGKTLF